MNKNKKIVSFPPHITDLRACIVLLSFSHDDFGGIMGSVECRDRGLFVLAEQRFGRNFSEGEAMVMKKKLICILPPVPPARQSQWSFKRKSQTFHGTTNSTGPVVWRLPAANFSRGRRAKTPIPWADGGSVPNCWDASLGATVRTRQLIEFLADPPHAHAYNTRCRHRQWRTNLGGDRFLTHRHSGMKTKHGKEDARHEVHGKLNVYIP